MYCMNARAIRTASFAAASCSAIHIFIKIDDGCRLFARASAVYLVCLHSLVVVHGGTAV